MIIIIIILIIIIVFIINIITIIIIFIFNIIIIVISIFIITIILIINININIYINFVRNLFINKVDSFSKANQSGYKAFFFGPVSDNVLLGDILVKLFPVVVAEEGDRV